MYIFVVKELLKLIWFSIIKKLLPMSQNTCYLSPQSIQEGQDGGGINIPPPLSSPVRGEEMKNKVAKWQKTLNQKSRR